MYPSINNQMRNRTTCCFLTLILLGLNGNLFAALSQDPSLDWQTLYTEHFEIHFHDGEEPLAHQVADLAEQAHTTLTKKYNWTPKNRTQVVLTDRFDFSNGSATPIPRNTMQLIISSPSSDSVIADHDNWLKLLIEHEYTHVLHLDKVSGLPSDLQKIFGRNLFLFPNLLQPPWLVEGLATYEETDITRGIGRGQSSQFRGLMRQEVISGIKPIDQINQPLVSWPLNTARYLYGVYFYQFIADRYGSDSDKIIELVENYSNNLLPFAINNNSKKVFGKNMTVLWDEFSDYLNNKFSTEIKNIQQTGVVAGQPLTQTGYFTRSPKIADNGDIYYLENDLQSEPQLMMIKQGTDKATTIANVRGNSFDLHSSAGIVGTEINNHNNTNAFSDLYRIDLRNNEKTLLTHGKRYLHASWGPNGKQIIALHNQLGEHALHLLDEHGNYTDTLWQGTDQTVISSVDWSTDGNTLLMSVWRPETLWNIELFDIKQRQWKKLTNDDLIESGPQFSSDNQSIIFSADYDGVFNLYQLRLKDQRTQKLTNVLGEAISPAIRTFGTKQQLVYIGLGANGYDLFQLDDATPITTITPINTTKEPAKSITSSTVTQAVPPKNQSIKNEGVHIEPYNALTRITPTSWFPYFFFDDERSEIGLTTFGADPLRRHLYSTLVGYDTDNQWLVGHVNYIYDRWNPTLKFSVDRQIVVYLDNAGEVERYRNSDTLTAEAVWPVFRHERQWLFHMGIVEESESDKKILSNFGPRRTFHERLAGLAFSFNSTQRYARSISASNGRQVRLVAEDNELLDSDYTGQIYTLDWREFVGLSGQHVISARAVAGWGTESPNPFRLGGTDETSVPLTPQASALALTQDIFGHRSYPLLGYDEGRANLRGRRMTLLSLDWRFPIKLLERGLMAPPVGLHQIHGKLIYNWGESWDQESNIPALRRGAGIEFTAEMVLGYRLPMNVRFGYAKGFDFGSEEQTYLEVRIPFL